MKRYLIALTIVSLVLLSAYSQNHLQKELYSTNEITFSSDVFQGNLIQHKIFSPGLENNLLGDSPERDVTIYLPPGYNNSPNNSYPVVYLLHGYLTHHNFWFGEEFSWDQNFEINALQILDNLISAGVIKPMIIVSPDSHNSYYGSWYKNSKVTGNWEDFIINDVIQFTDNSYNTLSNKESRGIGGHSMGGFGTVHLCMNYPYLFNAAYLLSAGFVDFEEEVLNAFKNDVIEAYGADNFQNLSNAARLIVSLAAALAPNENIPLYGEIPMNKQGVIIDTIWQKWMYHDPISLLSSYKDSLNLLSAISMDCGTQDHGQLTEDRNFSEALNAQGITHSYQEYEGNHYNKIPERLEEVVLPFFSDNLKHVIPGIKLLSADALFTTDTLVVEMDVDGIIYLVPIETVAVKDSLEKNNVLKVFLSSNDAVAIPLISVLEGEYIVYGMDSENEFVSIPKKIVVSIGSKISNFNERKEIDLYPIPAQNQLNIGIGISGMYDVEIISLNGQPLLSWEMEGTFHHLDLSSFQSGVYFITIRSKDFVTTKKIIKL